MPKKPPQNAYYFFMQHFREEQRKKGVNYGNLQEVAKAADPFWREAPPPVRAKFETMAKQAKQKNNVPEKKYTSTGISLAEIDQIEMEAQKAEEDEVRDIKSFVKLNSFSSNEELIHADIYLIDVNFYCQAGTEYIIGESTVLRFNVIDGIKDNYHEIINPDRIPPGYISDIKIGCEEYGLDMPDSSVRPSNYLKILANTIDYLKQQIRGSKGKNTLPPVYTMPDKVEPVTNYIQQMCSRASEDERIFRVYKLDTLFFYMINALKSQHDEGFPKQSLALTQLKKDQFKYNPGLGCESHEEKDKTVDCTLSRTQRWAYTILDSICPVAGIEALPGCHVPREFHVDSILIFKEQRKDRVGPSVAGSSTAMLSFNSSLSESFSESTLVNKSDSSNRKKTQAPMPMRMPKTDYSQALRPAPELTESDLLPTSFAQATITGRGMLPHCVPRYV
ncbi:protein maelstrom homolog [Cydia strobilella]|uniref:protein maelstrom homolog n=1 Tax=Cydia strobilella TaxID=1100964 RepID=UPI0030058BDF